MPVEIEMHGQLAEKYFRNKVIEPEHIISIAQVVEQLNISTDEIGLLVIDGKQKQLSDSLPENCRLCIFPWLSGG
jgi:hypothetical protein